MIINKEYTQKYTPYPKNYNPIFGDSIFLLPTPLPIRLAQEFLAEAEIGWSHFDVFIVADVVECILERHATDRRETDRLVRTGCAHIRELFVFGGVDDEVGALEFFNREGKPI